MHHAQVVPILIVLLMISIAQCGAQHLALLKSHTRGERAIVKSVAVVGVTLEVALDAISSIS